MRQFAIFALAAAANGCGLATWTTVEAADTATLKGKWTADEEYVEVIAVDGEELEMRETEVSLEPGQRCVKMIIYDVRLLMNRTQRKPEICFDATAGHDYRVEVRFTDDDFFIWIADAADGSVAGGRAPGAPAPVDEVTEPDVDNDPEAKPKRTVRPY